MNANQRGYLLIELMVSMVILGFGIIGVLGLATDSYKMTLNVDRGVAARILASNRLEQLTAQRFDEVAAAMVATPSGQEQVAVNNTSYDVRWSYQSTGSASDPIWITVSVDFPGSPDFAYPLSMSTLKTNFL